MNTIADVRRANLRFLIERDGLSSVARRAEKPDRQLNDMVAGRKSFGEKVARAIELNLDPSLKPGWLDSPIYDRDADHAHDKSGVALLPSSNSKADDGEAQSPAAAQPTVADLLERLRAEISTQPEAVKRAIAELMVEYVTTPDEATGRAVADAILRILGPRP